MGSVLSGPPDPCFTLGPMGEYIRRDIGFQAFVKLVTASGPTRARMSW